jgi:hypothetical protein
MIGDLLTALIGVVAIGLTTYTIGQTREQRRLDALSRILDLLTTEECELTAPSRSSRRCRATLYPVTSSGP